MVKYRWKIAEAKSNLSELVREAATGPQRIDNRGREVAVVIAVDEYERLVEQAAEGGGAARMQRFLELSAQLRAEGGAEIELPPREARRSPFADETP